MTTHYVKRLLQQEIVAALKTSPCIGFLNTTDGRAGVYEPERLDQLDGNDPAIYPCLFVYMPVESSSESLSANWQRNTYTVGIYLMFGMENDKDADILQSKISNAVRVVLAANSYTSNMRRMGSYRNSARVAEDGWYRSGDKGQGQNKRFKFTATYRLVVPSNELIVI